MSLSACTSLSSWSSIDLGGSVVHVLFSALLACTFWLALLSWAVVAGQPGDAFIVMILAPIVVSGVIALLTVGWLLFAFLRYLWRGRATWRPWKSNPAN